MDGGDIESGGVWMMEAEPDDCGRFRVTFAVGLVTLSIVVFSIYLMGPDAFGPDPPKPASMFVYVAGIICLVIGCCFFLLFGSLIQEWELGHPEGRRLVDKLMM